MQRKDTNIHLVSVTTSENEIGDSIETIIKRQVLASKKSIRQSEFYQAAATGLKPELTFVMWSGEYNGETQLEFEGKTYNIIRTYDDNHKEIELICSGWVAD